MNMFHVFLIKEVNMIKVPSFNELSVSKMWEVFKANEHVLWYFPDYQEPNTPEIEFLLNLVNTVYLYSVETLIQESYQARKIQNATEKGELIEITASLKENIGAVIAYKSNNKWN